MENNKPECFGDLEQVFPMAGDGLRHSPEHCIACAEKTACLRAAISGKNQAVVEEEKVDRAYTAGRMPFLERWARKKSLHNRRRKPKKETPN